MSDVPGFPIAATIAGVEVVTIPLRHYAELLEVQRQVAVGAITPQRLAFDPRSRIDSDPEVAAFLAENLGRIKLSSAVTACRERFGATRAPGRSTIARYWDRLRSVRRS